jgi:hypothetical protein
MISTSFCVRNVETILDSDEINLYPDKLTVVLRQATPPLPKGGYVMFAV